MKSIITFSLLILVATMISIGIPANVSAQEDLQIFVNIAKRAQEQINTQISSDSPEQIKELFKEGTRNVSALEEYVKNENAKSAKEHFLTSMKIFSDISRQLTTNNSLSETNTESLTIPIQDPTNILQRLEVYVNNIKTINEKQKIAIDFSELDLLFTQARQQIDDAQFTEASETIVQIKETITQIIKEHRQQATKHESQRAQQYAMKYLEQLDRLIVNAKNQDMDSEIIEKLENAKLNLSLAENPSEIVKEIRNIMLLKNEFQLTENDRVESKILQIEKVLVRLSHIDSINPDELSDAKKTLQNIKQHLSEGQFDYVTELLKDLDNQIEKIKNSI